jgi:hypothetical protein
MRPASQFPHRQRDFAQPLERSAANPADEAPRLWVPIHGNAKMNRRYWSLFNVLILFASLTLPGTAIAATSYAGLRAQSGSVGQTTSLVAPRIGGEFVFSVTDPYGYGDDGGIVIRAPNGWWVRKFAHTLTDPVKLDWFEVVEGHNVTTILGQLGFTYKPKLYVQVPTVPMTLQMDPIDFAAIGITNFAFLESDAKVSIQQTGDRPLLFYFKNMKELVFGTDQKKASRDDYNLTLVGNWTWTSRSTEEGGALVLIETQGNDAPPFYFRFNTKYPKQASIRISGGAGGPQVAHISGRFIGGGMTFAHMAGEIRFEDAYVADPLGYAHGWTGTEAGAVDKAWSDPRVLGVTLIYSQKVTGLLELQYGGTHFGSMYADQFGIDPSNPLVIIARDYGYTGPNELGLPSGVKLQAPWYWAVSVKFDGLKTEAQGRRWIKLAADDPRGAPDYLTRVLLEASQLDDNPNGNAAQTSYIRWTLANITRHFSTNNTGWHPDDRIHGMIYQGDGVNPAQISGSISLGLRDIVENGQFHDLVVQPWLYYDKHPGYEDGSHNIIRNVALTGRVAVKYQKPPANDNLLENVTWLGSAREVMRVDAGASVSANNLCAPAGSTIGGGGSVTVNGQAVTLPYKLQPSDCLYAITVFGASPGSSLSIGPTTSSRITPEPPIPASNSRGVSPYPIISSPRGLLKQTGDRQ